MPKATQKTTYLQPLPINYTGKKEDGSTKSHFNRGGSMPLYGSDLEGESVKSEADIFRERLIDVLIPSHIMTDVCQVSLPRL